MTKQQFIDELNRRLQIISEKERKDIIDEYCNHIDMRMAEGKSEEEAIEDFGDIDELISDILDAYKINTKSMQDETFEGKMNRFLDDLFEGLKKIVSHFTSLDMDGVVHLLFELFITLIILAVIRWPFELIADLGDSLLDSVFGFGIGSFFGGLWHAVVMIIFIVLCIVVIINIFAKRVSHYRHREHDGKTVIDDLKESFSFEQAKENIHNMSNEKEAEAGAAHEKMYHERQPYDDKDDRTTYRYRDSSANSAVSILIKIFAVLCMIPLIGIMVGLSILLAIMVVCSVQGFTMVGAYLIVIGLMIGDGAVIDLISSFAFKGGK